MWPSTASPPHGGQPKWVASRSLKPGGNNDTPIGSDVEAFVRRLKEEIDGDIDVAAPELAGNLTPSLGSSMNIGSTFDRSFSAAASRLSLVPGRRSVLSPPTPLARMLSG